MSYLDRWSSNFISSRSLSVERAIRVEGTRQAHLGPRLEFAKVEFVIEPADEFDAEVKLPDVDGDPQRQSFIEWAIFGFLDVVMMTEPYPTKNLKLTVVGAEIDPVSSSQVAFRLAGRDAARRFIEELRIAKHLPQIEGR